MNEELIVKMLSDLKSSVDLLNKRFDEHEKQQKEDFDKLIARFDEHEEKQKHDFEELIKRLDEHEEKQRRDFAKLEHVMYERTDILFDAIQVRVEKENDLRSKIKSIDDILEDHSYRILELESKAN